MYDRIVALLFEIGVDTSQATPQTTFRELRMDSLSLTELAVMVSDDTGERASTMTLDTTLAQAVQQLTQAEAQNA
ncbi:acyl carrier protein [Streptomyces sp. NPDC001581]|uniref:acyl carrier protein n=1 Tax=Streptomyces sp. NPDC001581 TaxID=3154386 RepID=UPI0033192A42